MKRIQTKSFQWPMTVVCEPIAKRVVFHFEGKKPTNRLDKPEWFLAFIQKVLYENLFFIEKHLDPVYEEVVGLRAKVKRERGFDQRSL